MTQTRIALALLVCVVTCPVYIACKKPFTGSLKPLTATSTRAASADSCALDRVPLKGQVDPDTVFRWITNSYSSSSNARHNPKWACWFNKNQVAIALQGPGDLPSQGGSSTGQDSDAVAISSFPLVQRPAPNKEGSSDSNEVAAVLFNTTAKDAVLHTISKNKASHTGDPLRGLVLPAGSVIVKTIWQIFYGDVTDAVNQLNITTITPTNEAHHSGYAEATLNAPYSLSGVLGFSGQGQNGCTQSTLPFRPSGAKGTVPQLSLDCFYSKYIPPTKPQAMGQINALVTNLSAICSPTNGCTAVLVGFHVMYKTGNPANWSFMTYWLTPQGGQHGLHSGPWQFFASNSTTLADFTSASSSNKPYVFNPYLEGPQQNGTYSNCANCHQFARYSISTSLDDRKACLGEGLQLGKPSGNPGQLSFNQLQAASTQYRNLQPADSLWSIVTYEAGRTYPTLSGNALSQQEALSRDLQLCTPGH